MPYPIPEDEPSPPWREPKPSTATLHPSAKPGKNSARPVIIEPWDRRRLVLFSELEAKAAFALMARPDCAGLYEQPPRVKYCNFAGIETHHTFDFLMLQRSGERLAIAVKPYAIAKEINLWELMKHIARQLDPSFANGILVLTDLELRRDLVSNGVLIHDARLHPDPEVDNYLRRTAMGLEGAATIDSLIKAAGLEGNDQAFYAVARAIGGGLLVPTEKGRISRDSWVRLRDTASA